MKILNIKIDNISKKQALEKVKEFLNSNSSYKIFTPNPEMIVDAHSDEYFKEVLNSGDLNICDGRGIQLVSKKKVERIPGTDFMLDICKLAEKMEKSVYFLGSKNKETLKKLGIKIKQKFPNLKIAGLHSGNNITIQRCNDRLVLDLDKELNDELISDIVMTDPDILFVAFGHGKQEKWIDEYLCDLPGVKIAMGVGGAFDFIAGTKKRAPKWLRKLGFEWLYRLIQEPGRIKRIGKATVVFLYLNIKSSPGLQG